MQVNFLPKKTGLLTYNKLLDGVTYKCVSCDEQTYIGKILFARSYGDDLFGVWLDGCDVLSKLTYRKNSMLFEEFKCELVEIE